MSNDNNDNNIEFGEEWLNDLESVLDFDLSSLSDMTKKDEAPESSASDEAPEAAESEAASEPAPSNTSDLDGEALEIDVEEEPEDEPGPETKGCVTTQTLNPEEVHKQLSARSQKSESTSSETETTQQAQFISLILMRLFDDFELLMIQKQCDVVCDLIKQFNRLANMMCFCGMEDHLPLLGYITQHMPFSFADVDIGAEAVRRFDGLKMHEFADHGIEILNCMMYVLRSLATRYESFDTSRFADILGKLYQTYEVTPSDPSCEAPLPMEDSALTSRTFIKVARSIEACLVESLHYIESCIHYGNPSGYADAAKCLTNAAQIANEYKFLDISQKLIPVYEAMGRVTDTSHKPPQSIFKQYLEVVELLKERFSAVLTEKKIAHLREMITKQLDLGADAQPLANRWQAFINEATPHLFFEGVQPEALREHVTSLQELAEKHEIEWLAEQFKGFSSHWDNYPYSCAEAFVRFSDDIQAFPSVDISTEDLEQLSNSAMRVLFARPSASHTPTAYSVVHRAKEFTEKLFAQVENPRSIDCDTIEDILIDARQLKCHALIRICEVILTLLSHISEDKSVDPSEAVVQGIYLCAGLFETICDKLYEHVNIDPEAPILHAESLFYESLLSLYQSPGAPRESITYFLHTTLGDLIAELQLVWVNSSTPTSTEYYCSIIRKLLHMVTICGFTDVRRALVQHLDELPESDFVNTENVSLENQYRRIVLALRNAGLPEPMTAASDRAQSFFTKMVSALNLLLALPACDEPSLLAAELKQLDQRMTPLGILTDFPPIIALLFDLHHMGIRKDVSRADLEALLYWFLNVAHNVCPAWKRPDMADLEFIKVPIALPTAFFQRQLEHIHVLYETFKPRSKTDPVIWEHVEALYKAMKNQVSYAPAGLEQVVLNAQNRCRYLKKNIAISLDTNGYFDIDDTDNLVQDDVLTAAFITVIGLLVDLLIDDAFITTDMDSQLRITLQPFKNSCSASITHNGRRLTRKEMLETLDKINIVPCHDDDILEMLVSSKRLMLTYPACETIALILPILKQFNAQLDISDQPDGYTSFFLTFHV